MKSKQLETLSIFFCERRTEVNIKMINIIKNTSKIWQMFQSMRFPIKFSTCIIKNIDAKRKNTQKEQ